MDTCTEQEMGPLRLSAIQELVNIGVGSAARALSDMTGATFNMSVPKVAAGPGESVWGDLGELGFSAGVCMPFEGDVQGTLAYVLSWPTATALWEMVLGEAPPSVEYVSDLQASMLMEYGNILNSSFLAVIGEMTGLTMLSTPPLVGFDESLSLAYSIAAMAEEQNHSTLLVETELTSEAMQGMGCFLLFPAADGLQTIFASLGLDEAA